MPIKKLIEFLIFMGGNTQAKELLEHFKFDIKTPTASVFIQQRNKLKPEALSFVLNNLYLDATVQAYRGYESYNNIAHLENKNWNYLIRVKAPNSRIGILSKTGLPVDKEFDEEVTILMTR